MSFRESVIVTLQTLLLTSFGASVGLEAGYTQLSSALSSHLGSWFSLRRAEIRTLVRCGAFYGFELIIGFYSVTLLAPLVTASLVATFLARPIGAPQTPITISKSRLSSDWRRSAASWPSSACSPWHGSSRFWARCTCRRHSDPSWGRRKRNSRSHHAADPLHGPRRSRGAAEHASRAARRGNLVLPKIPGATISLGTGFRGGLFFASLLLGALLGKLYAGVLLSSGLGIHIDVQLSAVVGMAALDSGIIGGPLTMSFLVLETTGNIAISAAVLVAAGLSAFLVRETFGYSFSTWRLHLRGENISSAHGVGRVRNLTVQTMMRVDLRTVPVDTTLQAFRQTYPLGSASRVVAVDRDQRYAGIIPVGLLTEQHLLRRYAEELDKGLKDLTG